MIYSRSTTGLCSVLAFACLAFAVVTDAQAQTRTRTGGGGATGSELQMTIQIADEVVSIKCPGNPPDDNCPAGATFFNATASTAGGQAVSCQWRNSPTDPWTPALCTYSDLVCNNFAVGDCSAKGKRSGTRTSTMTCPTPDASGANVAGCTGTINVTSLNGTSLETLQVGSDLAGIDNKQLCGSAFPTSLVCDNKGNCTQLKKFVIGTITQTCEGGAAWSPNDSIVDQTVRGPVPVGGTVASYQSKTSWLDETNVQCNPNNGFPTGACTNDGGTWLTIPTSLVPGTSDAECAAAVATLSCGQLADGSPGPAPTTSKFDGTQCQYRCDRCGPTGTLVNVGEGGFGKYVLSDPTGTPPFAAACDVTVTGN